MSQPSPEPSNGRDEQGYSDLRSYAVIGDGRTIALVAADGRVDWLPLPNLDSAVPFAALLDAVHGGSVGLEVDGAISTTRRYLEGTVVLETIVTAETGTVRITDSMNTGVAGRLPWSEFGRRIEGVAGEVTVRVVTRPGTCLNRASPWVQDTAPGVVLRVDGLTIGVRADGECGVEWDDRTITVEYRTNPGSRGIFGLVATEREPLFLPPPAAVDEGIDRTVANWRAWSDNFEFDGPEPDLVRRSVLTLKLLTMAATGSIAAAATTSLPESLAGGKNWDYRYAWVRDTAYTLTALFRFGLREETHAAMSWMLRTIRDDGDEPAVMYRLDGSRCIDAPVKLDVPGWRGIGPVVSGNRAGAQLQLGVFGDLFSIVRLYIDDGNVLDAGTGRTLARVADLTCDVWRNRDSGMWELPEHRHYTTSKMGCWQALDHAVHLAELGQIPGDPSRWRAEAGHIREWVSEHCWSPAKQAYVLYPGSDALDSSILLHAISGFDRGPRMSSTLDALAAELGDGPHLYRFSGAADEEATFVACSYWMVSALALVGRRDEARERLSALCDVPNDVGVLAEMYDPATGSALGNLPQALSHLALIHAAITLGTEP